MASSTSEPSSSRAGRLESLGEVIKAFVRRAGLEQPLLERRAVLAWPEAAERLAGERAAAVSASERIQSGEMIVRIKDPVWRHRLRFEEQRFVELLNEMAGGPAIRSIRFT